MGLPEREERRIAFKLKQADTGQKLRFKNILGAYEKANKLFELMDERQTLTCRCGSERHIKHGTTEQDVQRYRCKDCGTTFTSTHNKPFYRSNYSVERWKAFVTSMLQGATLVELTHEHDISLRTAFRWRHRILRQVRRLQQDVYLAGRVWADEAYTPANAPGTDGGEVGKVTLLTAQDYEGRTFIKPASPGRGSSRTRDLEPIFSQHLVEQSTTLVTDNAHNLNDYARQTDVGHETHDSKSDKMNVINWLHSHFKEWLGRFRGVGADYLRNYCAWFALLKNEPQLKPTTP